MTLLDLVQTLATLAKEHKKRVITLRDMATLSRESHACLGMTLLRAQKKKIVFRVGNAWINLMDAPALEEVAFALTSPSYISFESALYAHGIISQSPRGALTVACTGRPKLYNTPLGNIRFVHLKKELFFGFDKNRLALAEKAWLDLLYTRARRGERLSETVYTEALNRRRLKEFSKHFPEFVQRLAIP